MFLSRGGELRRRRELLDGHHVNEISALALSHSMTRMAVGERRGGTLKSCLMLWDLTTEPPRLLFDPFGAGHMSTAVAGLAFGGYDDEVLVALGHDNGGKNMLTVWLVQDGTLLLERPSILGEAPVLQPLPGCKVQPCTLPHSAEKL